MSAERDAVRRQTAARAYVLDLVHAHGLRADAMEQQALYDTLLAYGREECDALIAILVADYAAVLVGTARDPNRMPDGAREWYRRGRCDALRRVAERLGVLTLHEQAADVAARGAEQQTGPGNNIVVADAEWAGWHGAAERGPAP
jgi:hypothetical protein